MAKLQKTTIEIYKDKRGELRWRATFRGKTLADSSEGYKSRVGLNKALQRVFLSSYAGVYNVVDNSKL
jgi:uncharacterized protein YegP (UPF0339 family)